MNEERFTGKAEIYKKFRPSYPNELIDFLYSEVGFHENSVIADIGAGTGIFSRLMLERGCKVYCVEPNDDMRETLINELSSFSNFTPVSGNDVNTGLNENSLDFVTVAQAFHWFDLDAFKIECQRILKPGGKVVIVWNERDYKPSHKDANSEIVMKDYEIRQKYATGDKKGLKVPKTESSIHYSDFFADGVYEQRIFRNDLILDCEKYIGRNLSASYAPKEEIDSDGYHGFVQEMKDFFAKYSVDGILIYPHFTSCYVGYVKKP